MTTRPPDVSMSSVVPAFTLRYALGFLAFAYGWTWTFWTIAGLGNASIWSAPSICLFVVGGLGVPLGGVTMTRMPTVRAHFATLVDGSSNPDASVVAGGC